MKWLLRLRARETVQPARASEERPIGEIGRLFAEHEVLEQEFSSHFVERRSRQPSLEQVLLLRQLHLEAQRLLLRARMLVEQEDVTSGEVAHSEATQQLLDALQGLESRIAGRLDRRYEQGRR